MTKLRVIFTSEPQPRRQLAPIIRQHNQDFTKIKSFSIRCSMLGELLRAYQHKPLGDSSREIRLVNLQPGHQSDPIHVTLTHALLDGDVAYDALSYAWGDPNITLPIAIDGLPFRVTVNLESALRHLRLPAEPRVIWIDAICIHQMNFEERDYQVRRMGPYIQMQEKSWRS
jgi:hypothetical protein